MSGKLKHTRGSNSRISDQQAKPAVLHGSTEPTGIADSVVHRPDLPHIHYSAVMAVQGDSLRCGCACLNATGIGDRTGKEREGQNGRLEEREVGG